MKLILNNIFVSLFFLCVPAYGADIYKKYIIKVSGIKIGILEWEIKINDKNYSNYLKLKNEGLLSALYKFKGEYYSQGTVKNNQLKPEKYSHIWETNKTQKKMNLIFKNNKIKSLKQNPVESEHLRVDIFSIENTKDPLTSFLQIITGMNSSLVLDGRRLYNMEAVFNKKIRQTIIELTNYSNLWADHKRSKFEKIVFEKNSLDLLPSKILIHFDGRVFKLE